MKKFSAAGRNTINWASGTSTEIFIHPSDGSFADRNFLFRISTATVEAEESTFTFFEGITRHLMILKGQLQLIHEGRYTRDLQPFDQDTFSGEWPTRAVGKVTDFNLMLQAGYTGELIHHHLEPEQEWTGSNDAAYNFAYIVSGSYRLADNSGTTTGELIQFESQTDRSLICDQSGDIIFITVDRP